MGWNENMPPNRPWKRSDEEERSVDQEHAQEDREFRAKRQYG
jgi:hypothetical protein